MKIKSLQTFAQSGIAPAAAKYSNIDAVNLLKKELAPDMPDGIINLYISKVSRICRKLQIQFNQLPINKEHPDMLPPEKNSAFCREFYSLSIFG